MYRSTSTGCTAPATIIVADSTTVMNGIGDRFKKILGKEKDSEAKDDAE